ncbi:CocE/NonD family hydrolase [Cytobacillus kochii]|uniref:CocE/NonD family hydrolase n=1 Tax=Cytobacillus kochii TaxID=859143 RepID=UPI002E1FB444|nr:CocE/NonD family hydrolase [Cytobacillus kochii]MED1605079.1 CocE/NonD family hydrolase [Cytobacillus kochii]
MEIKKNVLIPMRDGVNIAADIYLPVGGGRVPALLALSPYGKELQAQSLTLPPQARPSALWNGAIEAGDIRAVVNHGYAHIIADVRGTGGSEGEMVGNYNSGGHGDGKDIYDIVEWMAEQDWCDGNIGMIGISYFASVQILGAAEKPPHLKALFVNGGHFDLYELCYHGGIMWLMPRASREGRGGDSGNAFKKVSSKSTKVFSTDELQRITKERLDDPDIAHWSDFVHLLHYQDRHELWMDYLLNPLDGPFWQEGHAIDVANQVEIPVYFQAKWGRGWNVEGTIECFKKVKGFKKLDIQPLPPMLERPFHECHDEMFRWYDYWLKGIDNGIVDEPTVQWFVEGSNQWRKEEQWPIKETEYKDFYLRPRHKLSDKPEPLSTQYAHPDGFYQAPLTVTTKSESVKWASDKFLNDVEMTGPGALYINVEIDTEDTNFIAKLYDVDGNGNRVLLTTGYLKASHRELDKERSTVEEPYHPHHRAVPVPRGEVIEYAIRLYPFSNLIKAGHRIELELACNESVDEENAKLLPPDSYHLPSGRATMHKIYRDCDHLSRLILPVVPKELDITSKF